MTRAAAHFSCDFRFDASSASLEADPAVEVLFHGYLSNSDELATVLGLGNAPADDDVIRAGYLRWGRDLPAKLDGQFALVVLDRSSATALLARDSLGVVPLYWRSERGALRISTRIGNLVDDAAAGNIDLAELGRYIRFGGAASDHTCYTQIKRLLPGTSIWVSKGRVNIDLAWDPRQLAPIHFRDPADYVEQFRELVERSVCGALMGSQRPWISLSGGLDSNTVLFPASRHRPDLRAFSIIMPQWPREDESPWIKRIVEQRGIDWTPVDAREVLPFADLPRGFYGSPEEISLYQKLWTRLNALVGDDVLLTGDGGDNFMGAQMGPIPSHLADGLFSRKARDNVHTLKDWAQRSSPARSLGHWLLHAMLLPAGRHLLRRSVRGPFYHLHPAWLNFGRPILSERPPPSQAVAPRCRTPGEQAILDDLWLCAEDATAVSVRDFSYRHPLFDRRLFEFLWAIPWSQKHIPGCDRYLQRRALKGVVDDDIRTRIGTGSGSRAFVEGLSLSREWRDYLGERPRVAEIGFVDADKWRHALAQASVGQTTAEPQLLRAITVEIWLKQFGERKRAPWQ